MNKKIVLIALLIFILTISGCIEPQPEKCGDGNCSAGENWKLCPADCPQPLFCGDKTCSETENWKNCKADCPKPAKPVCGDKVCEPKEQTICPKDCPTVSNCPDGICDAKETKNEALCPQDCQPIQTHTECQNQQCIAVDGAGTDECSQNSDCVTSITESHFGAHLAPDYSLVRSHIDDLGEQIYVRTNVYDDVFGWKKIKSGYTDQIRLCEACNLDKNIECVSGAVYYCDTNSGISRDDFFDDLSVNTEVTEFYSSSFSQLATVSASRYGSVQPTFPYSRVYPADIDIYKDYIAFLVNKFSDKIKYWVIENEVDGIAFWGGTPQEYADLVVIASEEIKQNCPDCKVGLSFTSPFPASKTPGQDEIWYNAIEDICEEHVDFVDLHYYILDFIKDGSLDKWKEICPGKEIISTETGIPDTMIKKTTQTQNVGGTETKQAQDLIKYNTLMFAEGYSKIFWYLKDYDYGMGTIFIYNGLIDEITKTRKPAFTSYKTMISKVDYFTSITKLSEGQYKYTFSNKEPVYVLWCDSGTCSIDSEITGNVKVTDYLGNAQTKDASTITLTESPIFVEETE